MSFVVSGRVLPFRGLNMWDFGIFLEGGGVSGLCEYTIDGDFQFTFSVNIR